MTEPIRKPRADNGDPRRTVAFLTDYGSRDGFAAVCHAVIAARAPRTPVLDLTHDVPVGDVRHGAAVLARAAPYLPSAIYLAVVDPGVGGQRRPIAVRAGDAMLVGPDNGLLLSAADMLGGVDEAIHLTNQRWWGERIDATFHGRDIFAPVAAGLATGAGLAEAGEPLTPATLVRLPEPHREIGGAGLLCEVSYVDGFGNVQLAATADDLVTIGARTEGAAMTVQVGELTEPVFMGTTFSDVDIGQLCVYMDSDRRLALAENHGNAARRLGATAGTLVKLYRC